MNRYKIKIQFTAEPFTLGEDLVFVSVPNGYEYTVSSPNLEDAMSSLKAYLKQSGIDSGRYIMVLMSVNDTQLAQITEPSPMKLYMVMAFGVMEGEQVTAQVTVEAESLTQAVTALEHRLLTEEHALEGEATKKKFVGEVGFACTPQALEFFRNMVIEDARIIAEEAALKAQVDAAIAIQSSNIIDATEVDELDREYYEGAD